MSTFAIQTLGSALIHFLWQGTALAILLCGAFWFTRDARVRYAAAVGTLTLMALCPIATFIFFDKPAAASVTLGDPPASWLVWIWCCGVLIFGTRAFGGWLMLRRLRRAAWETPNPALIERCQRLQQRMGVAKPVGYAHSEIVAAPAVVGWLRPVVLIPLSALAGLSVEQLEGVVAHELAHIKRFDGLVNLFQIAAETLLFYHPAAWWVNRVIRAEREHCCDDMAVAVCGNAHEYALALATMSARSASSACAMAVDGGDLKARVRRLLGLQEITRGGSRAGWAALAVLCAVCVLVAVGAFKQRVPGQIQWFGTHRAKPEITTCQEFQLTDAIQHMREIEREMRRRIPDLDHAPIKRQHAEFTRIAKELALRDDPTDSTIALPIQE
jgi:beta-lactamase regulating signal transducer with metallopeptidase domain